LIFRLAILYPDEWEKDQVRDMEDVRNLYQESFRGEFTVQDFPDGDFTDRRITFSTQGLKG